MIAAAIILNIRFSIDLNARVMPADTSGYKHNEKNEVTKPGHHVSLKNPMVTSEAMRKLKPILVKRFTAMFPNATQQLWASMGNDFLVYFVIEGKKASACFTKTGKFNYAITDYTTDLPEAIQRATPHEYASCQVKKAVEIRAYGEVVFQVIFENELAYTTIRYANDGVEKINEIKK